MDDDTVNESGKNNRRSRQRPYDPVYAKKYYEANREKINAATLDRRKRNPEAHKAAAKIRYLSDPERFKAQANEYRAANKGRYKEAAKAYRKANRDKRNAEKRHYRALKKGTTCKHTPDDIKRIHKLQNGKCAYCRKSVKNTFHVDHIVPLSKGGSNAASNLQILCPPCNCSKSAKDPIIFARQRGLLL